ncbi:MAG: C4-dicarboxylate ABC transporter substrate-binding protein [Deltaproteobacteria bacterium]|nr:MAG: C4-dicarboxylate ABC transporter substrate-binding protein [Deltaproteobacteria bacterium]
MKKIISPMVITILFCLSLFLISTPATHAGAIKLTYSNFFPPTHIQSKLAEAWCREVEKRTQGKVKIDYYAGQTLTKAKQCYDGVVEGLSDIGFSVLAYTRGRFPVMSAVDLPLGYTSGIAATKVVNAVYEKFKPKEIQDTEVMYLHAHGPGLVHTRGKAVRKLEDMKGLKFRAHGTSAQVVKALGGTPVPKPMPETYQMLQKGVVDGALYPLEANKGWKLGEVTDYCTRNLSSAYTTSFFVVMNKDKWNALPPDIQKTIRQINVEWAAKHGKAWEESDQAGLKYFLSQKGNEVIDQDAQEAARWKKAVAPIIDNYISKLDKKGFNGREIVDFAIQTLAGLQ